ncbi:sigma-70 family RNA polymerase sigma factor [Flavitalea sp. BT771]|uniref:RNA polymerase sigma factor n=1 Tax=Flavitalea sp. BT771 TaxID=3063329 RepID=UPI0026E2E5D5|nr:sigma-70 family RNA polymerase sigma factor [Flavitalea sp. BT771]MDO6431967.1 sigma-70 family RNA polymerase sigma factor [Flavitalea sp. BT771]MDV6220876.1 sigma-70 family RNA polymerase sigma factor [Flavitalea sp. BT771]
MLENDASVADEKAFNSIVQSYSDTLMRTAMHLTRHQQSAEDIVQEAFLRLWQHRNKIVPYNMGGWLHTVTTHLAYKHVEKEKRSRIYVKRNKAGQDWHTDVEDRLLQKESQNTYDAACMRLPERRQAVYRLSHEQGLSRDEIACQLCISPHTVKNHLLKAVQFMKGHIQTCGLLIAFVSLNHLFFISNSTKPPLRDLYNGEGKMNRKSQMEEVYTILYSGSRSDLKRQGKHTK